MLFSTSGCALQAMEASILRRRCMWAFAPIIAGASEVSIARGCVGGLFGSTVDASWSELSASQRSAVALCGGSPAEWDAPSGCLKCFADLEPNEQLAVRSAGLSSECYDADAGCGGACARGSTMRPWSGFLLNASSVEAFGERIVATPWATSADCRYTNVFAGLFGGCLGCFADLGHAQQRAVLALGSNAVCWDELWHRSGVDCTQDFAARRSSYDALSALGALGALPSAYSSLGGFGLALGGSPWSLGNGQAVSLLALAVSASTAAVLLLRHALPASPVSNEFATQLPVTGAGNTWLPASGKYAPIPVEDEADQGIAERCQPGLLGDVGSCF